MIVLFIIVAVIISLLLIALILPSSYSINKSITVKDTIEHCYIKIADLNHYRQWNPFAKMEPDAQFIISGTPNSIGHQYTWDGKKIGTGGLTIIKLNPFSDIELELEFLKPFKSKASDKWHFEQIENDQVKITWINNGELKFPMARLMGPMINKNLNKQFEKGLENIKNLCETNQ